MNGQLDTEALHAGMPAIDTKWVSQVWIRQTFREDGQPSVPVPDSERTLVGPLHKGFYRGHCLAGDDVHEGARHGGHVRRVDLPPGAVELGLRGDDEERDVDTDKDLA